MPPFLPMKAISSDLYMGERMPLAADGKYLFFQAGIPVKVTPALERKYSFKELVEREIRNPSGTSSDIYWIDAKIIEELRPGVLGSR